MPPAPTQSTPSATPAPTTASSVSSALTSSDAGTPVDTEAEADDEEDALTHADGEDEEREVVEGEGKVAGPEHCYFCFEVLYDRLKGTSTGEGYVNEMSERWKGTRYPLFVTWNTRKPGHQPHLRGCIGNFSPLDLPSGLADYALISAFKDRRFPSISPRELPSLSCSVSLLHSFEPCADYADWELGKHGIHLFFDDPKARPPPVDSSRTSQTATPAEEGNGGEGVGGRSLKNRLMGVAAGKVTSWNGGKVKQLSATYLPDVATDQGWTKLETIDSAIHKAGYEGKITEAIRRTLRVERYQSAKHVVTYGEWTDWRAEQGRPV